MTDNPKPIPMPSDPYAGMPKLAKLLEAGDVALVAWTLWSRSIEMRATAIAFRARADAMEHIGDDGAKWLRKAATLELAADRLMGAALGEPWEPSPL
jgi:hypothetical protein